MSMWEISNTFQIFGFCCAFAAGMILGAVYDCPRGFRKVFSPSVFHIAVTDVLFSVVAAFLCFFLQLALTAGMMRWYFPIAVFLGFLFERATLSRLLCPCFVFLFRLLRKGITLFGIFSERFMGATEAKIARFFQKSAHIAKKVGKSLKKLLKIG